MALQEESARDTEGRKMLEENLGLQERFSPRSPRSLEISNTKTDTICFHSYVDPEKLN